MTVVAPAPRGRIALGVLGILVALLCTTSVASAKTFDVTYDWNDGRYGFQGWRPDNAPPGDSAEGPFYTSTATRGRV